MNIISKTTQIPPSASEFFMEHGGIQLHMKLDVPESKAVSLPLVILVHGFTGHMEEPHLLGARDKTLEKGAACLRVEMYGHGLSGGQFCDHDIMKWLEEIVSVIDYAAQLPWVSKLILAGHSQGGLLTVLGGGERADKLDAIIPLSPGFSIPDEGRAGICFGQKFDPDNIPYIVPISADRILHDNYFKVSQKIYTDKYVKAFQGPVCIIHGDADATIPVQVSRDSAKLYKNCKLVEIPGDTHCFDNHLDQMVSAWGEFLDEIL